MRLLRAAFTAQVSQYTTTITCLVTIVTIAAFLALCIFVEGILKKG